MFRIIVFYLLVLNLISFLLFAIDKKIARENGERERAGRRRKTKNSGGGKPERMKRRVPEKILLLSAALGGSPGAIAGMLIFRHKTRHWQFRYGLPGILSAQMLIVWIAVWGI